MIVCKTCIVGCHSCHEIERKDIKFELKKESVKCPCKDNLPCCLFRGEADRTYKSEIDYACQNKIDETNIGETDEASLSYSTEVSSRETEHTSKSVKRKKSFRQSCKQS